MYFIVFKMRTAVIERASKINTGMKFKFSTEKQTNKQTKETKANKQTNKQKERPNTSVLKFSNSFQVTYKIAIC